VGSGIQEDSRARFEAEVLPHLDAAYRFARWLCRSPTEADDIVQEAVLRAFRNYASLRGSNAKGWLLAIVRNCHADAAARARRHAYVPLPQESDPRDGAAVIATTPDPETVSIRRDHQRVLERLMSSLPEEQREVLALREVEDMDYRQIAAIISAPIGTVMSRLARARAALKAGWLQETAKEGAPRAVR
jgi:RNA polymerase sigma-70 factor (ECF subfamily)